MKKMILAALAVMTLGAGVAQAQSYSHESPRQSQSTGQSGFQGN